MCFLLKRQDSFIILKNHLPNGLESQHIFFFVFFKRENKIKNKNPSVTPFLEKTCLRNRVQI